MNEQYVSNPEKQSPLTRAFPPTTTDPSPIFYHIPKVGSGVNADVRRGTPEQIYHMPSLSSKTKGGNPPSSKKSIHSKRIISARDQPKTILETLDSKQTWFSLLLPVLLSCLLTMTPTTYISDRTIDGSCPYKYRCNASQNTINFNTGSSAVKFLRLSMEVPSEYIRNCLLGNKSMVVHSEFFSMATFEGEDIEWSQTVDILGFSKSMNWNLSSSSSSIRSIPLGFTCLGSKWMGMEGISMNVDVKFTSSAFPNIWPHDVRLLVRTQDDGYIALHTTITLMLCFITIWVATTSFCRQSTISKPNSFNSNHRDMDEGDSTLGKLKARVVNCAGELLCEQLSVDAMLIFLVLWLGPVSAIAKIFEVGGFQIDDAVYFASRLSENIGELGEMDSCLLNKSKPF